MCWYLVYSHFVFYVWCENIYFISTLAKESEIFKTKRRNFCLVISIANIKKLKKFLVYYKWKRKVQLQRCVKSDHSCIPNAAEIEVRRKVENCKKRSREGISVTVNIIFKEEFSEIYNKGYDLVTESPTYNSAKIALCTENTF